MPGAGDLRDSIGFFRPLQEDDGAGNVEGGYGDLPEFTMPASVIAKLGREEVLAQRLAGTKLYLVTVYSCAQTRSVTEAWKARDMRANSDFNIRSIVDPKRGTPEAGRWLEMLCEEGAAV